MRFENDTIEPSREPDAQPEQEDSNDTLTGETVGDEIYHSGSVTANGRHMIHCLTIIGQVEGHFILPPQNKTTKYEHVLPQLVAIEESDEIKGLLVLLNTVGGDVEAGLAIAELISGMKKPTVSLILGGGHSIGVPLAVSSKRSFIVPSATMTIHPVRMNGTVLGVPQTLSYFEKMQERIVNFVTENSNITRETFTKLMMQTGELVMDVGTVLDGQAAVDCGLIDELGNLSQAVDCLYNLIDEEEAKNQPSAVLEAGEAAEKPAPKQRAAKKPKAAKTGANKANKPKKEESNAVHDSEPR